MLRLSWGARFRSLLLLHNRFSGRIMLYKLLRLFFRLLFRKLLSLISFRHLVFMDCRPLFVIIRILHLLQGLSVRSLPGIRSFNGTSIVRLISSSPLLRSNFLFLVSSAKSRFELLGGMLPY
jgi:hypothetical protein